MDATVYQITRRRQEVATHQAKLKELAANLSDDQKKELADWEKSDEGKAVIAAENQAKSLSPR